MSQPPIPPQVTKLLPLLASDKDGEVIATARAICRTLGSAGLDMHALVRAVADPGPCACARRTTPPSHFDLARAARSLDGGRLSRAERQFVDQMCSLGNRSPSPRQSAWLADLYARLRRDAA